MLSVEEYIWQSNLTDIDKDGFEAHCTQCEWSCWDTKFESVIITLGHHLQSMHLLVS